VFAVCTAVGSAPCVKSLGLEGAIALGAAATAWCFLVRLIVIGFLGYLLSQAIPQVAALIVCSVLVDAVAIFAGSSLGSGAAIGAGLVAGVSEFCLWSAYLKDSRVAPSIATSQDA